MISWDEEGLRRHEGERGVAYGTQKIDHPDTPFLYPRDPATNTVQEAVGHGRKQTWDEDELKHKLGLLAQKDAQHEPRFDTPKYTPDMTHEAFLEKRKEIYGREAEVAAANEGLPDGWCAFLTRSEPREIFYFNESSGARVWDRPGSETTSAGMSST